MAENTVGMACRVCGVVDDRHGEDILEPDGYDLEWLHYACRTADSLIRQER